ncbi:MAG: UvrB/UvrC motif-containing protein [Oscillospiraceae bacterium]|jgi:protein arginine kinase activator|nr:UvrB/UvrC motif-containing protein [Oscillospiraceae bacterium]
MKCEKCGMNEANFHFKQNFNGQFSELHLCDRCAQEAGLLKDIAQGFGGFSPTLTGGLIGFFDEPQGFVFGDPRIDQFLQNMRLKPRLRPASPESHEPRLGFRPENALQSGREVQPDAAFTSRRELNMLREQMKQAAENEDFEKAASLRDKIKKLESES